MQNFNKISLIYLVFLMNIFNETNIAQFEGYQKTNGPYGYRINKIRISAEDNIYICTSWQGLFYSEDSGNSWKNIGLKDEDIHDVVIDSKGILYALLDNYWRGDKQMAGIFRSLNNGKTWTLANLGISDPAVRSITLDIFDNIFVGTKIGGIFHSNDSAKTWVATGLEDKFIRVMESDQNGRIYAALDGQGIYHKDSLHHEWERLGNLTFAKCQDIFISKSGEIFLALGSPVPQFSMGVYKSNNNGKTWIEFNNGIDDLTIQSISGDYKGNLFAGATNGRVYKLNNFGESWELCTIGLTSMDVTSLRLNSMNEVYMGTLGSGLFKSKDVGNSWLYEGPMINLATNGIVQFNNKLFCSTGPGIYFSNDRGKSWIGKSIGLSPHDLTGIVMTDSSNIFIGTWGGGVFHSNNSGESWRRISEINSGATITFIERSKKSNSIFFGVKGLDHGVYKSENNGESWQKLLNLEIPNSILIRDNGDIFIGSWDIHYSNNDGQNWSKIKKGQVYIHCLAVDSTNNLLAGSMDGFLYSSNNYGQDWNENYFPNFSFTSINVLVNGIVVASTYDKGSYFSSDNGSNWEIISTPWLNKSKILKYNNMDEFIYICTDDGLYYKNSLILEMENNTSFLPHQIELFNAYPNPFNPTTKISFFLPQNSAVALKIFNIQGKEIATLVDNNLVSGKHSVNFEGSKYASGIYFYSLITPNFSQTKKMLLIK